MDRHRVRDVTPAGPCLWRRMEGGCDSPTALGECGQLGRPWKDPLMGWVAAPILPGLSGGCL